MSFAVEEINMNPAILPNVTLGLHAYDSCDVLHLDLAGSLQVLSGTNAAVPNYRCLPDVPLAAVIGAAVSTNSILLAHILGLYRYPQISHLSTSRVLSDHKKFPSFFRTVPSDAFQSQGLAKLVLHFGWTWVGLLAMDDDYGQQGIQLVKQEILKGGACVAFSENIALNQPDRNAPHIVKLLHYMKKVRLKLNGGREIYFNENGDPPAVYDIVNWQLSPDGSMKQVKIGSYDTSASPGRVFTISSSILQWDTDNSEVPLSVCSQNCPPGFWKAAKAGKPSCCFECIPCSLGEISNDTGSLHCFRCPWDQWPNSQKSQCLPKDLEYLSYKDPLGKTLAVISLVSSLTPDIILRLFIIHKATPVVKANNYTLSCLLLIALSLCFLCSLAFIGYPQTENCLLRQAIFGMVFGLCISCVLAKTIIVMIAFMATKPSSNLRKWTKPWVSYMIVFCGFMVQFLLCVIWLSLTPPFPQYNANTKPGFIIVECNEGSSTAFWTMLGYLFLLATISFVVAFLARKLPDTFNEAQFITFSMLAFLSVWISYIPASLSAQGKYTVAMEIFAILASSWALVFCMFFPKCFIIVFRPNRNTKENIMRKDRP